MSKVSTSIKELEQELSDYETLDKLTKERTEIDAAVSLNKTRLEEFKVELLQKKNEEEELNKKIPEISIRVDGLNTDYIEACKELKEFLFSPTNEITVFEEELPLSEIKRKFQIYRKNVEGSISDLQDLQEAIEGLNQSIDDVIGEIDRKNKNKSGTKYNIKYFNSIELFAGNYNCYLEELDKYIDNSKMELKKLNVIEREFKSEFDKLEGAINTLCNNFKT